MLVPGSVLLPPDKSAPMLWSRSLGKPSRPSARLNTLRSVANPVAVDMETNNFSIVVDYLFHVEIRKLNKRDIIELRILLNLFSCFYPQSQIDQLEAKMISWINFYT